MASGEIPEKHRETINFVDDPDYPFPNLKSVDVDWASASDPTEDYNCMGMAVGVRKWWSPPGAPELIHNPRDYWPLGITDNSLAVEAFVEAAETCGFNCCQGADWEDQFERIVLLHDEGEFRHAAVQVGPDRWLSKFGDLSDFEHTLTQIQGYREFGDGRQFMKRPRRNR